MMCLAGVPSAGRGLDVLAMMCLAGVSSAGRGLDVLAMMCLAGVPSAGRGLDVLSRPGQQRHAPIRDQSAPSNIVT